MQNTLLALAIALIAAIVAALVGPWLIDWNGYRPRMEAEASRLIGRPVTIGGDLSIRLLPTIQIDARDVTVGDAGHGARIGRFRSELRVAPLLRGEVSLTSVHIRDADVVLAPPSGATRLLPAEEIVVENARLSVASGVGQTRLLAERMMLTGESRGARGPVRLEGSATVGERVLPLNLTAALTDAGALALRVRASDQASGTSGEADGIVATGPRARFDGEVILSGNAGRFAWRVSGNAGVTPEALVIERAEAQLGSGERAVRATGSLRHGWAADAGTEAIVSARQVDLDRLVEAPPGTVQTPRDVLAALVAGAPGLARPGRSVSVGFDIGGVTLAGAPVGDLKGDMRSADAGWRIEQLSARLPGGAAIEASGAATLSPEIGFAGRMTVQASRPAVLMSWLDGQATPEGTLDDPIRLTAAVRAEPGRLTLDGLDMTTAAGSARGRIALDVPALGRHALMVELAADAIDLDLLLRLAKGAGARLDPATDTRLQLKADQARLGGLGARGLDLSVATDGRTFDAERIRVVDLAGFGMDLAGRLDGIGGPLVGRLSGQVRAANVDGLVSLLARNERTAGLAGWLRDRAPSLADADLRLTFAAGGRSALGLRIEGRLGEGSVLIDAAGSGDIGRPEALGGRTNLTLEAPRADQIYALVAGHSPAGTTPATPTRLALTIERPAADLLKLTGDVSAAGSRLAFAGERQPGGASTLSASLSSTDLSPVVPLVGIPAELAAPLPSRFEFRATARGGTWRIEHAQGQVGPTTVAATLDGEGPLARGRVRLGSLSAEALAAILSGPAWLLETDGAGFPGAAFGTLPIDGIEAALDLSVERIGLGSAPPVTSMTGTLARTGGRTALRILSGRIGEAALTGDLALDRSSLRTILSGRLALDGVRATTGWPGLSGSGRLELDLAGDGASPSALVASLQGSGRVRWSAMTATGVNPAALARVTRQAELAQDIGRPLSDMAFGAALAQALEAPMGLMAADTPVSLSGTVLRASETTFTAEGGRIASSGSLDLAEGRLTSGLRVVPDRGPDGEAVPAISVRFQGALAHPVRHLDTDDVSGWLGLRLVDRAALRIQMTESDRLERVRQRAFSRFTMRPPPPVEVPLPPMPTALPPELVAPPAGVLSPLPDAETPRDGAPLPQRRPSDSRPAPRAGQPQAAPDLPSVVRRALDGTRPPAQPSGGAPLSILPPLPPPVEVGPAPGNRR